MKKIAPPIVAAIIVVMVWSISYLCDSMGYEKPAMYLAAGNFSLLAVCVAFAQCDGAKFPVAHKTAWSYVITNIGLLILLLIYLGNTK